MPVTLTGPLVKEGEGLTEKLGVKQGPPPFQLLEGGPP